MADFTVDSGGVLLSGEEAGEGPPVALLHGLTATRRYVVMGSRFLERSGHRVLLYDARGHGRSGTAGSYSYDDLAGDLLAVLDDRGVDRAVLAGGSMGAHTIVRFALDHPGRVGGLVIITPAFDPDRGTGGRPLSRWDELADGLRRGGIDGFLDAYGPMPDGWRDTVARVIRQRMSGHERLEALADALQQVPRSRPFEDWVELRALGAFPVVVIASRDEADPEHPLAVGERYAQSIPGARLLTEDEGSSPLAWQGAQVSRVIAEVAA